MSLRETLIKYTVALISGFLISIVLTIGYIAKRSEFKAKRRYAPPEVLTDSSLWKHGYLSLKVSTHLNIYRMISGLSYDSYCINYKPYGNYMYHVL
jgi:hypothetical protein